MSDRPALHVIEALFTTQWAMQEDYLRTMLAIAGRSHDISPEALEAMRARRVADAAESLATRDGVAIISIRGPLFRYADFFSSISGATTYEGTALDLGRAANDSTMRAILLSIDSPGGDVNGVQELAQTIRTIDETRKPVVAYVGGTGASAAYLLASAARSIVIAPNAILGSIGVRAAVRDTSARDERLGVRTFEFVSSQSPNKQTDPSTDAGRARIQAMVDALAAAFIAQVAVFRDMTPEQVVSDFNAGGVLVGEAAVAAGMGDRLGSFEATLAELAKGTAPAALPFKPKGFPIMAERTADQIAAEAAANTRAIDTARTEAAAIGAAAAMTRVRAILALDEAKGREPLAQTFAFQTDLPVEKVKALLAAAPNTAAGAPVPEAPPTRRSADAPNGLVLTEDRPRASPLKIDHQALYEKFAGRGDAARH